MSQRTKSPSLSPSKMSNSCTNKFPTLKQQPSPSPTNQYSVNSGKTSPSYEIPPRYKNFNCGDKKNRQQNEFPPSSPSFKSSNNQVKRLRTRSGSNSPPPLEPKLLKPKEEKGNQTKTRTRPEPVLSKEILEAKTPSVPSSPSNLTLKSQSPQSPLVQNKFVFTPKSKPTVSVPITKTPTPTPTQIMNEYCKHFSIKTHITTPEQCHFCKSYIFRPYVKTNCCGKIYHSDCLSMLYTDKISFDLKNGNTMNYIYFNCECGFSNLDKECRNYHNLTKIFNYFELNIRNNIKV